MSEVQRLLGDLRRAYGGDAWHGPALAELLRGVDATSAAAHPVPGLHSIWEIVLHAAGWAREVARRLQGHPPQVPAAGDWPAVADSGDAAWDAARADLAAAHAELERALAAFPEGRLGEPAGATRDAPLGTGVTFAGLVNGLLQHDAYHGGQIALLKQALAVCTPLTD
jgi:hypothetical protein